MTARERWDQAEWRAAIGSLRAMCPAPMPVSVRRCKLPDGHYGDTLRLRDRFAVRVSRDCENQHHALLVLAHEWAHALSWDLQARHDDHHEEHWGLAYSRCYRAVFPENR